MSTDDMRSQDLRVAVEAFLYREAELLDERLFPEWLDLFTEDCQYWVPGGDDLLDATRKVSIVHDDKRLLTERVWRFQGGLAYAQQPASVTSRLLGNICLQEVDDAADTVRVTSRFVITEFRERTQVTQAGRYEHELVRHEGDFRIRRKQVMLVNRNGFLGNVGLPL